MGLRQQTRMFPPSLEAGRLRSGVEGGVSWGLSLRLVDGCPLRPHTLSSLCLSIPGVPLHVQISFSYEVTRLY